MRWAELFDGVRIKPILILNINFHSQKATNILREVWISRSFCARISLQPIRWSRTGNWRWNQKARSGEKFSSQIIIWSWKIKLFDFFKETYGVTFDLMHKIDVNGPNQIPLYKWMKDSTDKKSIHWNFTNFVIDRCGKVVKNKYESHLLVYYSHSVLTTRCYWRSVVNEVIFQHRSVINISQLFI